MTSDRLAGAWYQIKGKSKERWGKLLGDDLKQIEGHAEQLVGELQGRYGLPHGFPVPPREVCSDRS
jgi:uncharacterized protein YjbJ (UPF0337 family)